MKKRFIPFILLFCLIFVGCGGNSQPVNPAQWLKEFYIEYITECEKNNWHEVRESLRNTYLTKDLLKRIQIKQDDFLNYDPISQAQDCFPEMLNGLEVIEEPDGKHVYTVVTDDNWQEDGKKRITYQLKEEDGIYKIDRILSDSNFN